MLASLVLVGMMLVLLHRRGWTRVYVSRKTARSGLGRINHFRYVCSELLAQLVIYLKGFCCKGSLFYSKYLKVCILLEGWCSRFFHEPAKHALTHLWRPINDSLFVYSERNADLLRCVCKSGLFRFSVFCFDSSLMAIDHIVGVVFETPYVKHLELLWFYITVD